MHVHVHMVVVVGWNGVVCVGGADYSRWSSSRRVARRSRLQALEGLNAASFTAHSDRAAVRKVGDSGLIHDVRADALHEHTSDTSDTHTQLKPQIRNQTPTLDRMWMRGKRICIMRAHVHAHNPQCTNTQILQPRHAHARSSGITSR